MFRNTTYTDFRTSNKDVLIPSYFIQNVTKLNINWLFG